MMMNYPKRPWDEMGNSCKMLTVVTLICVNLCNLRIYMPLNAKTNVSIKIAKSRKNETFFL